MTKIDLVMIDWTCMGSSIYCYHYNLFHIYSFSLVFSWHVNWSLQTVTLISFTMINQFLFHSSTAHTHTHKFTQIHTQRRKLFIMDVEAAQNETFYLSRYDDEFCCCWWMKEEFFFVFCFSPKIIIKDLHCFIIFLIIKHYATHQHTYIVGVIHDDDSLESIQKESKQQHERRLVNYFHRCWWDGGRKLIKIITIFSY
jgi:hypothetical protein